MLRISTRNGHALPFILCLLLLAACQDKDEHYGRPEWLEDPIYQQLEARGNFKILLASIDKAGYRSTLSAAGYFTLFAPNDDAFAAFFQEHGIKDIREVDSVLARQVVTYALIYNSFERSRLADYQANTGWIPLNAFKRRTAYYTGVYNDTTYDNEPVLALSSNRNGAFIFGDNNNKYIPYFISEYFAAHNITASDYNYFFPGTPFSGFNVVDARVLTSDIIAENGVIHEVDRVIMPLPSIEAYMNSKDEYSIFKDLYEKYAVTYSYNVDATNRYKVLTGSSRPVYVKLYASGLGFSPCNENFMKVMDNDGQSDGWTVFIPTNGAVTQYINDVLLEHYNSLDEMPPSIIYDFLNAHMWQTTVWPSKFSNTLNTLGEEARFDKTADVEEAKVLSNGMFYGVNKVQQADVFRSVYGKAYLNPQYSLMSKFLERELKTTIISPYVKFTLFLVPDDALRNLGYSFNIQTNEWTVNGSTSLAVEQWSRLIEQHVLITPAGGIEDLSGQGIVETYGGEYIKYNSNTVYAAGNLDNASIPNVTGTEEAYNGVVHYLDVPLRFPVQSPGIYIRNLGDEAGEPYKRFFEYLSASSLYNATTGDILGVATGSFHTFFIPTNAAIDQAVADGVLPATVNPSAQDDKDRINNFILYHILPKFAIVNNGKEEGAFESLYKTLNGDATTITIANNAATHVFTVTDMSQRTANVVNGPGTNVLSNRAVIHQIDNYLKY